MPKPTTLRIPDDTRDAIEDIVRRTRRDFSSVTNEMLAEAVRMRRIPGIIFVDGPAGRRARVAGTGVDVFEVSMALETADGDIEILSDAFPGLSQHQLRAALAYAKAYPEELEERKALERRWDSAEAVWEAYPFTQCST